MLEVRVFEIGHHLLFWITKVSLQFVDKNNKNKNKKLPLHNLHFSRLHNRSDNKKYLITLTQAICNSLLQAQLKDIFPIEGYIQLQPADKWELTGTKTLGKKKKGGDCNSASVLLTCAAVDQHDSSHVISVR